jgi:hypothetical protein
MAVRGLLNAFIVYLGTKAPHKTHADERFHAVSAVVSEQRKARSQGGGQRVRVV